MKTRIFTGIALSVTLTLTVHAQVPGIINYQGRIVDGGTNVNGTGRFEFALVNPAGTTNYWSNDGTAVGEPAASVLLTVTKGLYSVLLGDTTLSNMTVAIPATTFANPDVRLRVWFNDGVNGFQQLSPDQRVAAAGYAMMAATVPNGAITGAQLATNAVTSANLAPGAVTTAAIANGAVGANQLASNSVNSLIQSNLAANGLLMKVMGNYSATNQYYLMAGIVSSNEFDSSGVITSWVDIWGVYLAASPDGTNITWTGPEPVLGFGSPIGTQHGAVNEPVVWLSTNNNTMFYSYSPAVDTASNSLTIYTAANPTSAPVPVVTIDFSNLVGASGLANMWLVNPAVDATPGIVPTNLFVNISTNHTHTWNLAVTTCLNPPAYSLWTAPSYIPVVDAGGNPEDIFIPHVFQYHGTNMVLFSTQETGGSIVLATNTTSPTAAYTVWKTNDWGHWLAGGANWMYVGPSAVNFLPDRIRIYADINYTNGIYGILPLATCFSDCFDDWNTWTPMTQIVTPPLNGSSARFIRMADVIPVPPTNAVWTSLSPWLNLLDVLFDVPVTATGIVVQGSVSASEGFTDATGSNITSWTQLASGITNGNTTTFTNNSSMIILGSLNVSNRVSFGALQQIGVPIITNTTFAPNAVTNCFIYCDTSANIVSNVLPIIAIVGQIFGVANIGSPASNNLAVIDFGVSRTLTNNGSRYLSMYPGQHIIVQKINGSTYASLADNVFGGITTNVRILNASTNASTLYFTNGLFKGMSTP